MVTKFPKYIRIESTEMVRIGLSGDNKATYFRPCGEWSGDIEFKDGKYYMPIIDHAHTGEPILMEEISALDFLKHNPYGYSDATKNAFERAINDCGIEDKVIIKHDGWGKIYTHKYSD